MRWFSFFALAPLCACASSTGDARQLDAGFFRGDADVLGDTSVPVRTDAGLYPLPDGGTVRADRFVTRVVSFAPGECAGFGAEKLPDVVLGPPEGGGTSQGGTDVVSLGRLGTIVLGFEPNAIVDGPGPDFVVFENAFYIAGNPNNVYGEPGEISVSEDGIAWSTWSCTTTKAPWAPTCAGIHPVLSSSTSNISPLDYPACGGDAFDLADLGLKHAKFVRVHDIGWQDCPTEPSKRTTTNGFDLDAISILNAEKP